MKVQVCVWGWVCVWVLVALCWVEAGGDSKAPEHDNSTVSTATPHKPTEPKASGNFTLNPFNLNTSMIQRALYVLIVITIIGMLYFLIRAVRLKKMTTPRKKYGLLTNYDDTVEMAQLESDEEEDTTVYEARSLRR